jgi:hypothetical protein
MLTIKSTTVRGPYLVLDGLVLFVDAANPKSYNGTSNWIDLTKKGNVITLENSPGYETTFRGGVVFDGNNDRARVDCGANLIRNFNSTTHFVVKLPQYSGGQRVILSYRIGGEPSGGGNGKLYIGKFGSSIFTYYDVLNIPNFTAGSIIDDTVAIVTVVLNATAGTIAIWINGDLVGTATGRTGFLSSYNSLMYLGYDDGGTNEYMLGSIYCFMHYNRVLTDAEIVQNYEAHKSRFGGAESNFSNYIDDYVDDYFE